jgi:hypothetical protein
MAKSSLSIPVLANNPVDRLSYIKETVGEIDKEVQKLRNRQANGTVPVESVAAENAHFLIRRLNGELNRLGLVL